MATLIGTLEQLMPEVLSPMIMQLRQEVDPFIAEYIWPSSDDVTRAEGLGRDFKVRKVIELGVAGACEYDDILGNDVLAPETVTGTGAVDDNFTLYGENAVSTFPGLNEMVGPGWVPFGFQLLNFKGNTAIPIDLLRAENLPSTIGAPVMATIKGIALNVDNMLANTFWKENESTSSTDWICRFAGFWDSAAIDSPADFAAGDFIGHYGVRESSANTYKMVQISYDSSGTPTAGSSGQIRRLYDGMRVDIYTISGATGTRVNAADQPVIVDQVNPLQETFNLKIKTGSNIALADATTYYLVARKSNPSGTHTSGGSRTKMASGLVDWVKSSGTLGVATVSGGSALSLSRVPMLRSYVIDNGSAALSELALIKYLARAAVAYGGKFSVDTLVGEPGLWVAYFDELDGATATGSSTDPYVGPRYMRNRQGKVADISGGLSNKVTLVYGGRTYVLTDSPKAHQGVCWGIKTRDRNYKLYVAPRLRDAGTQELFSDAVEFLGPLMGYTSIFIPVNNPGSPVASPTNFRQMPFLFPHEICPDEIPGLKITGCTATYGNRA